MLRRITTLLVFALAALAATSRLYLKDGSYQMVREYQVVEDRVRYYSTERGDWEEIPLAMVDLDRSRKEVSAREEVEQADAKQQDAEDAAIRAQREEVARIPVEPGAYYIHESKLEPLKAADMKIVNNKSRKMLKMLSPIPIVAGKSTVEIDGETSKFSIAEKRPEFYFRLSNIEGFAIVKITPKKLSRVVETLSTIPVSNEIIDEQQIVPTFKREVGEQLFRIWPEKPLDPGEYALIQFTPGTTSLQVWDFSVAK